MSDMLGLRAIVTAKRTETPSTCSIELRGAEGRPLPAFSAGAHVHVRLPGGSVRAYSLCNNPSDWDRYVLGVHRSAQSRGGSRAVHERVAAGEVLCISAPRNHFALAPQARHSVLVAAGIGITPLLSMAEHLGARDASFELHYVARSRETAAFLSHLECSSFSKRVRLHLSAGVSPSRIAPSVLVPAPNPDSHLYVCGPPGFMDAVLARARLLGWPLDRLHQERFAAVQGDAGGAQAFGIRLARSGAHLTVGASESVVQALAAAGVHVPVSCEQGVCGTCLTRVLAGEPDHRDMYLSPEERARNDCFLPCCSRAASAELTLDL